MNTKQTEHPGQNELDPDFITKIVFQGWGIESPVAVRAVSSAVAINSRNVIIELPHAKYILKSVSSIQKETLENSILIQEHCSLSSAPVPRVIRTLDDFVLFEFESWCFALMEFIETEHRDQRGQAVATAHSLGQLHRALQSCQVEPPSKQEYDPLSESEIEQIKFTQSSQSNTFISETNEFLELTKKFPPIDSVVSPKKLIHLDCHQGNVRFPTNGAAKVIDFGHIQRAPRMLAIALACHRFTGYDKELRMCFFESYSLFDSLFQTETDHYWHFVAAECMRRVHCLLRLHYFQGCCDWDFELPRQLETLRRVESLLTTSG